GEASYIGPVGNDRRGEFLRDALLSKGVDVSHVRTEEGDTAVSYVAIVNGERTFTDFEEGVMADYSPGPEEIDFIASHDLAVTGLWGHSESALEAIRARGIPTAYDASDAPFSETAQSAIAHTTVFFLSDDRSGEEEIREKLCRLHAAGPELVIATRGGRGSMLFDGKDFLKQGIVPCEVVDTMGAGDSYIAGFLVSWLRKRPLAECMKAGAENAAVTIGYSGAWE
ncbi:MAG: fructoselysine 6-kinase, partial [Clostridia bacterium]|nr:fructoselysine 6-kinase [Clostridia bacterium]